MVTPMPYMRSASAGIFIRSGSVYETEQNNGIAHFIEHMLFKGSRTRTAEQIAEESDRLGGTLNAYTAEECTCIYIKTLGEDVKAALELIADIACQPVFDPEAIEKEKNVVQEEIINAEDNPEDAVQEMLMKNMFSNHPVGQPVLGSAENVQGFDAESLRRFYEERYSAENMLISVAGNVEPEEIRRLLDASPLARVPAGKQGDRETRPKGAPCGSGIFYSFRDVEQLQMVAGYPCVDRRDDRLFAFLLLSQILSGDSSSRLFRRLREDHGLVYNVDAAAAEYEDTGVFLITTGFSPSNYGKVTRIIREEILDILENGILPGELDRAKRTTQTALILEQESTSSVMSVAGKRGIFRVEMTGEEVLRRIDALTCEEVRAAAQLAFGDPGREAVALVGDAEGMVLKGILAE